MRIYLTQIFILISAVLLLVSCSSVKRQGYVRNTDVDHEFIPVFNLDFKKALYKANITISKRNFTSLVFIKKMIENKSFRTVFLSEAGLKYFDIEFFPNDSLQVHYVIDFLDKKALINTLTNDLKLILKQNVSHEKIQTFVNNENESSQILRLKHKGKKDYYFKENTTGAEFIDRKGCLLKKVSITLSEYEESIPKNISIEHVMPKLRIDLKRINFQ